jgi:hypothetical protein
MNRDISLAAVAGASLFAISAGCEQAQGNDTAA